MIALAGFGSPSVGYQHPTARFWWAHHWDAPSFHALPPTGLQQTQLLVCKLFFFFCPGCAAFGSWLCPFVPSRGTYGGHASFQPYMEAKHWYLCWACYEGFWQALRLSRLTLTRPRAQCSKRGKERQREESWLSTGGPCRTGEDPPSASPTPASS